MSNVHTLPGTLNPIAMPPNEHLVKALKDLLVMAESGTLQSYIGTGFTNDSMRVSTWCDFHDDVYQMLGSLEWLKSEYVDRHAYRLHEPTPPGAG